MDRQERRKAVEWLRMVAMAEYKTADGCRKRLCTSDVCEYHRNRGSAFIDAAIAIESQAYLSRQVKEDDPKSTGRKQGDVILLEFRGERLPRAIWARRFGISVYMLAKRLERGWDIEKALLTPATSGSAPLELPGAELEFDPLAEGEVEVIETAEALAE